MARINPDTNDILVYKLDETSGVYRNTGSTLPNDSLTDLTVSGTIVRTGTGVHGTPCPWFPGTSGYPSGASATRNYLFGANTINPQPPISISFWVNQRSYINNGNFQQYVKKLFRDHTVTNTSAAPFFSFEISNASTNSGQDLYFGMTNSITTQTNMTITDFPMPLFQWNHIGVTHDGTNIRAYLNGCQLIRYSGTTQLNTLAATSSTIIYNDISYAITNTTGTYVPGVDDIGNHGDEVMTSVTLPFNFTFFGVTYSSLFASSNGFVEFGQSTQGFGFTLPDSGKGPLICVFERDENTAPGPTFGIFTTTTGTAPNRTFIIEWRNQPFGGGSTLNYELKLFEGSSTFETLYTTSTSASTGCVGIQSAAGGKTTIFSNSTVIPAANTRLIFTPTTSASGYLAVGATPPYLVTSSPTKEEANFMISDLRIANVVRPLSYFQQVYNYGVLPNNLSTQTIYYKLRAYDLSCVTPTAVTWVDTQISLANAPAFPCSGPYSPIEIIDSWLV